MKLFEIKNKMESGKLDLGRGKRGKQEKLTQTLPAGASA
jgi:hypothetical protein